MILLLDVNALLAMHYKVHVHHARVTGWISRIRPPTGKDDVVLATCPITELGFVRIGSGKAAYAPTMDDARLDLRILMSAQRMRFIPDDLATHHLPGWVRKSAQTTDGYLLALAKFHGGQLATLDQFIPDAFLIPDESSGPLMVRDEAVHAAWALQAVH